MSRIIQALVATGVFLVVGIMIFVPAIIVTTEPFSNWQFEPVTCGDTEQDDRINCFPEVKRPTARQCNMRGCCYQDITWDRLNRIPECYFPLGVGYRAVGEEQELTEGFQLDLFRLHTPRFFYEEVENLRFRAEYYKENILHLKMYEYRYVDRSEIRFAEWEDRNWKPRYEVPLELPKTLIKNSWGEYEILYQRNPFTFQVKRKKNNINIFDTRIGGLVFEDQFLQISTKIPNSMLFGLGEHTHRRYRHEVNWHTYGIFAADNDADDRYANMAGHHPFFMGVEDGGDAFGVLLVNSNAQDIQLTPSPGVTWRTIGGIFDFWIFTGPNPEDVIAQYTEIVGRPHMPPFWALGMQLGRADWSSVDAMQAVVDANLQSNIPFDAIYSDVTYMKDYMSFTYDDVNFAGLPDFVNDLNAGGKKFIITMNSGVSNQVPEPKNNYHFYYYGQKYGYFINETDKLTPARGYQWPGEVSFSDFTNPDTRDWWADFAQQFAQELPFDGVVMDMTEPGNLVNGSKIGCGNRKWNFPPWVPTLKSRMLYYKTVCMDYEQHLGVHYNVHSLNGHFAAETGQHMMEQVKEGQRSLVLSSSTYSGTGRYAGHALGRNKAGWDEMQQSLVGVMEFNLFGIPYVGPNVCGYYDNADLELCVRWTQMAAFFPLFRIYKARDTEPADPASLGVEYWNNVKEPIQMRYRLLPYIYTLFYHARLDGWSVVRPVLNDFSSYEDAWEVDWEFLLGSALMVVPALHEGETRVNMYVPDDIFYNFRTGEELSAGFKDSNTTINVPLDSIGLYQRGGFIIPLQQGESNSSEYSRKEPIELRITIPEDLQQQAYGDMFWDDGTEWNSYERHRDLYLEFFADQNRIEILSQRVGMIEHNPDLIVDLPVISNITMYGMQSDPGQVAVDNKAVPLDQISFESRQGPDGGGDIRVFRIVGLELDIISDHIFELGATADP